MNALARGLAIAVAFGATVLLVAGSQIPWRASEEGAASIRLSWRSVSEPVSECRTPTPEELAALPPHMRMKQICERRHAPFRLRVRIDGAPVRDALLEPSGASGDRPLYVFEEFATAAGVHRVQVEFQEEKREGVPPPPLVLDAALDLGAGDVALVGLDEGGDRLVLIHGRQ